MKPNHFVKRFLFLCCFLAGGTTFPVGIQALHAAPGHLRCEWKALPIGVDSQSPRLSWRAGIDRQTAYQVQVASSLDGLNNGKADVWDSGKIQQSTSVCIPFAGKPLQSRQVCFWRVRVWQVDAPEPGSWSEPASWEMGLLKPSDWQAKWIKATSPTPVQDDTVLNHWYALSSFGDEKNPKQKRNNVSRLQNVVPATRFRKTFTVSKPVKQARLYSAAAGYLEVSLDQKPISPRIMNPAQTDFDKRVLYDVDVLDQRINKGDHVLSVHLGQGFYGQNVGFGTQFEYGEPQVLLQLEITYDDGTTDIVTTDETWQTRPSEIIKNNVYAGEVVDARRIENASSKSMQDSWVDAQVSDNPPTEALQSQMLPPVRIVRDVEAVQVFQPDAGVYVFDFGQNFTGVTTLDFGDLSIPAGTAVFLRYSEWADLDGRIDPSSDGAFATGVHQVDAYVIGENLPATFRPTFTWHGFRYVEVTGMPPGSEATTDDWVDEPLSPEHLVGHLVRSNVATRGTFECSDAHLNRVHETALWTYESNLISLPSDCPIRERCGWTGDAHASLTMSNLNFDMAGLWEKYLDDFATNPAVSPMIVPGLRRGNSHPDWAVAQILIAWERYLHDGDQETLRRHYPRLKKFLKHFQSQRESDGVVRSGFGDWCDPVRVPGQPRVGGRGRPQQTMPAITSTGLLVYASGLMAQISNTLGKKNDANQYLVLNSEVKEAFHRVFFDEQAKTYGSQTADSMALSFDIVPETDVSAVARSMNQDVLENWNGHASVGALGHRWLYSALSDHGYADTALGTFYAKGHPGFYYLFDELRGTSLWERKGAFDPATMKAPIRSLSHPFQGGYDAWFYQGLGGILPDASAPGYKQFFLAPNFVDRLDWVKVDFESRYGMIQSHWMKDGDQIQWNVTVPDNTTATIKLSGSEYDGKTLDPGSHQMTVKSPR